MVDAERYEEVARKLSIQERDAIVWRDACCSTFRPSRSDRCPPASRKPSKSLDEYKAETILNH